MDKKMKEIYAKIEKLSDLANEYFANKDIENAEKTIEQIEALEKEYVIAEKKEAFIGSLINVIIVICLGMFGVHKFIKGQIILGLIYICTYGLFGVGLFIDAIKAFRKLLRNAREYRMAKMVRW